MRAYFIQAESGDTYYVRADSEEKAGKLLLEAIGKFVFTSKLSGEFPFDTPKNLGENILVEWCVREITLTEELSFEDITPMVYVMLQAGDEYFAGWTFTEEEALCQE